MLYAPRRAAQAGLTGGADRSSRLRRETKVVKRDQPKAERLVRGLWSSGNVRRYRRAGLGFRGVGLGLRGGSSVRLEEQWTHGRKFFIIRDIAICRGSLETFSSKERATVEGQLSGGPINTESEETDSVCCYSAWDLKHRICRNERAGGSNRGNEQTADSEVAWECAQSFCGRRPKSSNAERGRAESSKGIQARTSRSGKLELMLIGRKSALKLVATITIRSYPRLPLSCCLPFFLVFDQRV